MIFFLFMHYFVQILHIPFKEFFSLSIFLKRFRRKSVYFIEDKSASTLRWKKAGAKAGALGAFQRRLSVLQPLDNHEKSMVIILVFVTIVFLATKFPSGILSIIGYSPATAKKEAFKVRPLKGHRKKYIHDDRASFFTTRMSCIRC